MTKAQAREVLAMMREIVAETRRENARFDFHDVGAMTREAWCALSGRLAFYADETVSDLNPASAFPKPERRRTA